MLYALISRTGEVVNIIELEAGSDWAAPSGHEIVEADRCNIGDTYVDGVFKPNSVAAPTRPRNQ